MWKNDSNVLLGCLDGCVHQWDVGGATQQLLQLEGSVLHVQFDHQLKVLGISLLIIIIGSGTVSSLYRASFTQSPAAYLSLGLPKGL